MSRTHVNRSRWLVALLIGALALTLLASAPTLDAAAQHTGGHEGHEATPCEPTAEEQASADRLVADTEAALTAYPTPESAEAAGYEPFGQRSPDRGREGNGTWHYVNHELIEDGGTLDPAHIEAIIYGRTPDGGVDVVGGMYIAPRGTHGPRPGGCLTTWHTHTLGTFTTAEMLHVWLVDLPDGPFAHQGSAFYTCQVLDRTGVASGYIVSPPGCEPVSFAGIREEIAAEVAAFLGLAPEALQRRIEAGESLASIAEGIGVSRDDLAALMLATVEQHLGQMVSDGQLTREQADRIVWRFEQRLDRLIDHQGSRRDPEPGPTPVAHLT